MKTKPISMPSFKNESDEADWWASSEGRKFARQKSVKAGLKKLTEGSPLVAKLNKTRSVQIALRVPEADLAKARKIAESKGIGYQTLLKMLLHEGIRRESRRQ